LGCLGFTLKPDIELLTRRVETWLFCEIHSSTTKRIFVECMK
jgi:hypothetical protein